MPEDAGSASLPLVAEAWAWTLQPPLSPSNLCTSGSGASADDLSTAPDQVDTTRSNGPYSAPSDLASPAAASREDDSVGREVRESETSSRREDMTTDASPQDEIRAAEANCRIPRAHGQPGGSTSDGDMDPYHAVECAGAVWIQALHLLNRWGLRPVILPLAPSYTATSRHVTIPYCPLYTIRPLHAPTFHRMLVLYLQNQHA